MGSGSSKSRPATTAKEHNEDEFKRIKNWEGETVGWVPRTDSDKLRRKALKKPPIIKTQASTSDSSSSDSSDTDSDDSDYHKKKKNKKKTKPAPKPATYSRKNSRSRRTPSPPAAHHRSSLLRRHSSDDSLDAFSSRRSVRNRSHFSLQSGHQRGSRASLHHGHNHNQASNGSKASLGHQGHNHRTGHHSTSSLRRHSPLLHHRNSMVSRRFTSSDDSSDIDFSDLDLDKYDPVKRYATPKPTLHAKHKFSKEKEASLLYNAFIGAGTDEMEIIEVLGTHTGEQRQQVKQYYHQKYREDLDYLVGQELSGHFRDLCLALLTDDLLFDVRMVHQFIESDSNVITLIGVLAKTSPRSLRLIKSRYKKEYKEDLDRKISTSTYGGGVQAAVRQVLQHIFSDDRDEGKKIDHSVAQKDAEELVHGYRRKSKEVFGMFVKDLMLHRNANQMREICEAFRQITHRELSAVVAKVFKKEAAPYCAYIEACDNSARFFAERLHKSFQGSGNDDVLLINIVVARSEIDLQDIARAYKEKYKTSLSQKVKDETNGYYEKLLLKLLAAH